MRRYEKCVGTKISDKNYEDLKEASQKTEMHVSEIIRMLIQQYLETQTVFHNCS